MTSPIDKVIAALENVTRRGTSGRQWFATCPAHNDTKTSLSLGLTVDGNVLMKCFAGCKTEDVLKACRPPLDFKDLYVPRDGRPDLGPTKEPLRLGLLAWDKRLDLEFLKNDCKLVMNVLDQCIEIPYFDQSGKLLFKRERTALSAKEGSKQPQGVSLVAYGLERLNEFKKGKRLVFVEGESDSWTGWYHKYPFIGIPGADAAKTINAAMLEEIDEVFVVQEPGKGGETFVNGISKILTEIKYAGKARVVSLAPFKDPNALHQADPDEFKAKFDAALAAATDMPPPVDDEEKKKRKKKDVPLPTQAQELFDRKFDGLAIPSPGHFPMSDTGNSQRLVFQHGSNVRYCPSVGWHLWDGRRWEHDWSNGIFRLAVQTVRTIWGEAAAAPTKDGKEALEQWENTSESLRHLQAMVKGAESMAVKGGSPIYLKHDDFDANPWLLGVENGTIDLRTGVLHEPRREDYITKQAGTKYLPGSLCPTWLRFLDRVMGGDKSLIDFLQLAVGYSLTGVVSEKCFFFLYGKGDNGKSVFVETIEYLMGGYQSKTSADTILDRGVTSAVPNDLARLEGARFVSTAELPENRKLDEARVKDLTGRDTISARFLRREWFQFKPVFKLWMYGNHRPRIAGTDDGIWRRLREIPFTVSIPKAEQDENLPAKLRAELPGILNWAVEGCLKWQKVGLPIPLAVQSAVEAYRSDMDTLGDFVTDRCLEAENAQCTSQELYDAFKTWCKDTGEFQWSMKRFGNALRERGYQPARSKTIRGWKGITPRQDISGSTTGSGGLDDFSR